MDALDERACPVCHITVRRALEAIRAGRFDDPDVQFYLRTAAGRILRDVAAGKPPNADIHLGLKRPQGRPHEPQDRSDLAIAYRIAQARLDRELLKRVRIDLAQAYGVSVERIRQIEREQGDLRRVVLQDRARGEW